MKFKKIHAKEQNRELSRRALIGYLGAAGAALSVPFWKIQEVIEGTHGKAWAATLLPWKKTVYVNGGVGGFSRMASFFPMKDVGMTATNTANGGYPFPGQGRLITGNNGNRDYFASPAGELIVREGLYEPTILLGLADETHTRLADEAFRLPNGNLVPAVATIPQAQLPALLQAINVNNSTFGTVAGGATATNLGQASDMVNTFVSASAEAGGILFEQADAQFYNANVTAFAQTFKAANKPTMKLGLDSVKQASNIVGLKIKDLITMSGADEIRYGLDTAGDGRVRDIARFLGTTEKMLQYGLCSSFSMEYLNDDPHGYTNDMAGNNNIDMGIAKAFGAFTTFLTTNNDPVAGNSLHSNVELVLVGDTPKSANTMNGWPDGSNNTNRAIVFSDALYSGQFGDFTRGANSPVFWNPQTGEADGGITRQMLQPLVASALLYGATNGNRTRDVEELGGQVANAVCKLDVNG